MEYSQLKRAITSVIKENGNEEITGQLMQDALIAIINALGLGFQFMGKATPATDPGTPDARVFYIAFESGLYSNFGGVTLDGKSLVLFLFSDNWSTITIDVPTSAVLADYLKIADLAATTGQGTNTSMTQKAISDALDGKVDKVTGKGLSTNDFTNALKSLVENSIQQSKIVQELGDDATAIISQAAMTIILAGYAKIDGYYQSLTAGAAENLVGRGSVPASFLRRTTGGTADIGTGSAKITKLMGNSIVWNQLINKATIGHSNGYVWGGTFNSKVARTNGCALDYFSIQPGHIYMLFTNLFIRRVQGVLMSEPYGVNDYYLNTGSDQPHSLRFTAQSEYDGVSISLQTGQGDDGVAMDETIWENSSIQLHDLTLMFGAGNEPTTGEAFKALYPLDNYANNPGVVLPFAAQKLVTTGFNQWDEVATETGYINVNGNVETGYGSRIASTNLIPVIPGKEYYFKTPYSVPAYGIRIAWYDAKKALISVADKYSATQTSPDNARYMRFNTAREYASQTYNNDICINLSWSGYRNGEYEPYEKHEAIIDPYNWSDTDGNDVYPFGGMHGVGTARDYATPDADGFIRKAYRVMQRVDLGTLTWTYYSETGTMGASLPANIKAGNNIPSVCEKYAQQNITGWDGLTDKNYGILNGVIRVNDTAYTDAAAFKAAMLGVYLYYELANPVEIELATPVAVSYYANDWGTEAWEPENTDVPYTAPCDMLIAYAMNAVDTLRRLPENYISTGSFENFCTELATKLGAALNKTITITPTYNDTTQEYNFTISIVDAG